MSADSSFNLTLELCKTLWGGSHHTVPALMLALVEGFAGLSVRRRTHLVEKCKRLRCVFRVWFGMVKRAVM